MMPLPVEDLLAITFCVVLAVVLANLYVPRWRKPALAIAILAAAPLAAAFVVEAWSGHAMRPLDAHAAPITAMAQYDILLAVADQSGMIRVTRTGPETLLYERKIESGAVRALYFTTGARAAEILLFAIDDRGEAASFAAVSGESLPVSIAPPQPEGQSPNQVAPQKFEFANPRYIASTIDKDGAVAILRAGSLGDANVEEAYELRVFGQILGYSLSLPVRPTSIAPQTADPVTTPTRPFLIGFADGIVGLAWGGASLPVLARPAPDPKGSPGAPIVKLASSPDNTIASVDAQGKIALWRLDPKTGEPIKQDFTAKAKELVLRGHESSVISAAFNADGSRIVTASYDNTARLWDAEGIEIAVLKGHEGGVTSAAFNADGSRIVTASWDNTARLWDAEGKEIAVLKGHEGSVISAAFNADGSRIVTASSDNTARLWDAEGKEIAVLKGHEGPVNSAAFNADGSRIVTASSDNTARLWDAGGKTIAVLKGHEDGVTSAAFNAAGSRIVTASSDNTARLWDAGGKAIAVLKGHEGGVRSAAFSADGSRIVTASSDNTARLWDAEGKEIVVLEGHEDSVISAAFNADGSRIVTASSDNTARLWDAEGKAIAVLKGYEDDVMSAAFSADGSRIVTASDDRTARIWDARADSNRVFHCQDCKYIGFREANNQIELVDGSGHQFWIDRATGEQIADFPHAAAPGKHFLLDPASFTRLVAEDDGALTLKGGPLDGSDLPPHTALVSHALFLKDGRIVTGAIDGSVRVLHPDMQTWLDRFDVWPELSAGARAAMAMMTTQELTRPVAFEQAVAFALQWDGEKLGLDQALYDQLRAAAALPSKHLSAMTPEELRDLAYENFWLPFASASENETIARILFDSALVMGRQKAFDIFVRATAVPEPEGGVEPAPVDPEALLPRILDLRLQRAATRNPERNQRTEDRLRALAKSVGVQWTAKKAATTAQ